MGSPAIDQRNPSTAVAEGERLAHYEQLARSGPVQRATVTGFGDVWLVTGYEPVRRALLDDRLVKGPNFTHQLAERLCPDLAPACYSHMLTVDGEAHTRLRRLVNKTFTRGRVDAFAPRMEELVAERLDVLAEHHPDEVVDLIEGFAYPLPLLVIFDLIGMPFEQREPFHALFNIILAGPFVPEAEFAAAFEEMVGRMRDVVAAKRRAPCDDLMCDLIAVRDGGDRLTDDELTSMIYALVAAGHETTANLIGNGLRVLLRNPEQLARWRADPDMAATAVEELLRFDSPLHAALPLIATVDFELEGTPVRAGDKIVASLMAANRDGACAADPDRLDLGREHNHHIAFGHGVHHCLGATLARIEGRIALSALIARFPDLELVAPTDGLRTRPNPLINGLESLPVRLGKQAA